VFDGSKLLSLLALLPASLFIDLSPCRFICVFNPLTPPRACSKSILKRSAVGILGCAGSNPPWIYNVYSDIQDVCLNLGIGCYLYHSLYSKLNISRLRFMLPSCELFLPPITKNRLLKHRAEC